MVKKRLFDKFSFIKLKKFGGKKMFTFLALVLVCITLGSFGQIYIKKGLNEVDGFKLNEILSRKFFTTFLNPNVFLGLSLYVISTVFWLVLLPFGLS